MQVLPLLAASIADADGWSLEALEHALAKAIRFNGSARAGVSADTLRYYERRGLLRPAGRRPVTSR